MKEKILELRKKGLSVDEIVNKLGCAKSTISYHLNNNGLGVKKITEELINKMNEYYLEHTKNETAIKFDVSPGTVTKYCNNKRVYLSNEDRKKNAVISVVKRRKKIKELSVEYKGGCCEKCGYNKYQGALEFHHLDPTQKDFNISHGKGYTFNDKIKNELDKCILVCANCHREIHGNIGSFA